MELARCLPQGRLPELDLVTSPRLAVHWVQRAPAAAAGLAELRQVAAARCAQLFGGTATDWRITGDWRRHGSFVCAALPEAFVRPLEAALASRHARWRWHTSWGWLCRQRSAAIPGDGWTALRSPTTVILWACAAGEVVHFTQLQSTAGEPLATLAERTLALARLESIASGLPTPGALHWIDLCTSDAAPSGLPISSLARGQPGAATPPNEATAVLALSTLRLSPP
ncbi:hypothetical protein JI739_07315 [Ramlibacter sp. AW1]|uniref:Uncharacterized protein n=1 Tax=Ramlibacter aurantiacus TaxID=2801330 RepID=A0A937D149_9BURK|nr:hypothetical protein [Ramlibacter aurantiacus]MBL0420154.1 hypothetical protein [Ramlibacter aurantiacus]